MKKILYIGLAAFLGLSACKYGPREVAVSCIPGNEPFSRSGKDIIDVVGNISFRDGPTTFVDEGYDGTLDRVFTYVGNKELTFEKGDEGFEEFVPKYLDARERATRGE